MKTETLQTGTGVLSCRGTARRCSRQRGQCLSGGEGMIMQKREGMAGMWGRK